jgi:hypothetical protein
VGLGLLVLGSAEVTAEAFGLRELHLQRLESLRRIGVGDDALALLPTWVYFLMGTLISGPYLGFKASRAWEDHQFSRWENWLWFLQGQWIEQRRANADAVRRVQTNLQQVEERLSELKKRREVLAVQDDFDEETKARLDGARCAAVAEAAGFHARLQRLVRSLEPLPPGHPWLRRLWDFLGNAWAARSPHVAHRSDRWVPKGNHVHPNGSRPGYAANRSVRIGLAAPQRDWIKPRPAASRRARSAAQMTKRQGGLSQ